MAKELWLWQAMIFFCQNSLSTLGSYFVEVNKILLKPKKSWQHKQYMFLRQILSLDKGIDAKIFFCCCNCWGALYPVWDGNGQAALHKNDGDGLNKLPVVSICFGPHDDDDCQPKVQLQFYAVLASVFQVVKGLRFIHLLLLCHSHFHLLYNWHPFTDLRH